MSTHGAFASRQNAAGGESIDVFRSINADHIIDGLEIKDDFTAGYVVATGVAQATIGPWTVDFQNSAVASSVSSLAAGSGGIVVITPDAGDDDTGQIRSAACFLPATGRDIAFEARLKISDATQSDLFVGLALASTAVTGLVNDMIGFKKDDGDANLDIYTRSGGTPATTDSGTDIVSDTYIKLGVRVEGTSAVKFYINGAYVGQQTTYIPSTTAMAFYVCIQNGEGAAKVLTIDWARCVQRGR